MLDPKLRAQQLHQLFVEGHVSAKEIAAFYLERAHRINPEISAFIDIYDDLFMEQAEKLDLKRAKREPLGRLAGVPIAIKDNIHIKGKRTTCGSKFLENYMPPFDATATKRLLEEDALFIGKTNMDEFAMGSSTENSAFFKTKNPWDLNCVPGGSSGGSAAAVAANLAPIALGSDTGGSIRQPASLCGLVGFKPTYGSVSRYGLVAYGSSLDQIGPFSKSVEDTALAYDVMRGVCSHDATSLRVEKKPISFGKSMEGVKIGVPWHFLEKLGKDAMDNFCASIDLLKEKGAIIEEINLDILEHSLAVYYILATAEASTNLARFDGVRYGYRDTQAKTIEALMEYSRSYGFGKEVKRRIILGTFVLSAGYQSAYYRRAQKVRTLIYRAYEKALEKCDIIATPTSPFVAFNLDSKQDPIQMYLEDIYTIGVNLGGLPAINLPTALHSSGKPMGIQFIADLREDEKLLEIADSAEKIFAFKHHPARYI